MKIFNDLIEEILESTPVNVMGGGFSVTAASSSPNPNIAGYDPVMGMRRRKKKKLKEIFAGCPVFEVSSDDFTKCSHGRIKYERWNKKMNMEDVDNQDIRTYAHRNPGKPIIIKDSTYGTMSWFVPRQNVNESVELDEAKISRNPQLKIGLHKGISVDKGKKVILSKGIRGKGWTLNAGDEVIAYPYDGDRVAILNPNNAWEFVAKRHIKGGFSESVELDEVKTRSLTNPMKPAGKAGKTEFAVVAKASGMFIKAFSTEKIARQYIKNQYSVRKKLKGKLGIIEVPLGANIVSNQMKRFGKIEVVKESVEQLDEYGVHTQKTGGEHHPSSGKYAIKLSKSAEG